MLRKSGLLRMFGNQYILTIIALSAAVYAYFVFPGTALLKEKNALDYVFLAWSHLLSVAAAIAFVNTVITDPGKVPNYWGFFMDDCEEKRRRYCLICHLFKPERCHHCSTCNRCVLNMDHHCPWLNNCIGFFNRKFFLLYLGYTLLLQFTIFCYYMPTFLHFVRVLVANRFEVPDPSVYIVTLLYLASTIIMAVIGRFLKFHLYLVFANRTTIENLELVRKESQEAKFTSTKPMTTNYPVAVAHERDSHKGVNESKAISKLDITTDTFLSKAHHVNLEEKKHAFHDEELKSNYESFNVYQKDDLSSVIGN